MGGVEKQFEKFKRDFGKVYETAKEEARRLEIFTRNLVLAETYSSLDGASYGVTPHADLTLTEFRQRMGLDASLRPSTKHMPVAKDLPLLGDNAAIDWTSKGAVTPVKNQGQCGSCWAFSTTGNLEGVSFLKTGKLVSLSEQQLVDCDTKQDQGCQGGLPSNAFEYIIQNGGIDTEDSYPYKGVGGSCEATKGTEGATISNWTKISTNEDQIAAQLTQRGPLSIGINAGMMQMYTGGVACPWKILCNPQSLDHGVLIVGHGTDNGKDYWKIKNSWGKGWGEEGYYRICKGQGACGLNQMVTSAIV